MTVDASLAPVTIAELHPLKYPLNDLRFIRTQKLIVTAHKLEGEHVGSCFGQAVIPLTTASFAQSQSVASPLERYTRVVGALGFDYLLSL